MFLLVSVLAGLCITNSFATVVPVVNNGNFSKTVEKSEDVYLVMLVGELDQFDTIAERAESLFGIKSVQVDCLNTKSNKKLCSGFGITQVPSFLLYSGASEYNPYTKRHFRTPIVHTGKLEQKAIEKFIAKNFPNKATKLDRTVSKDELVAEVKSSKTSLCVLFSEKETIPLLYKSVFFEYGTRITSRYVYGPAATDLATSFDMNAEVGAGLVMLQYESDEDAVSVHVFDGDVKDRTGILTWMNPFAAEIIIPEVKPSQESSKNTNIKTFDAASFQISNLDESTAWILNVHRITSEGVPVEGTDALTSSRKFLTSAAEGVVRTAELHCDADSLEASVFCANLDSTDNSYLLVVPFQEAARKKLTTVSNLQKWTFRNGASISQVEKEAKKAALDSLPEFVVGGVEEGEMEGFMRIGYEQRVMTVILISDKDDAASQPVPGMLRNMALALPGYCHIGIMSQPSAGFLQQFGNPPLPTLIALHVAVNEGAAEDGSAQFKTAVYNAASYGSIRFGNVMNFIMGVYAGSGMTPTTQSSNTAHNTAEITPSQDAVIHITSSADAETSWEQQCGAGFKGICVLGLLASARNDAQQTDYVKVVSNVMDQLLRRREFAAFKFLWVDASCQSSFASSFATEPENFPTLIAYSAAKNRYASYMGVFKEHDMSQFLQGVVAGSQSTAKLFQTPVFDESAKCNSWDGSVEDDVVVIDAASGEEMEDFLAEIQREEVEKARLLQEELEQEAKARSEAEAEKSKKKKGSKSKKKKSTKAKKHMPPP